MIGEYEREKLGEVTFGLEVEGDHGDITSVRLALLREGSGVIVEGKAKGGEVTFDLSRVRDRLTPGDYDVRLEVVVDKTRFFVPVQDTARITGTPKVEAAYRGSKTPPPEPAVTATLMPTPLQRWILQQESMGRKVVETADGVHAYENRIPVAQFEE